MRSLGAVVAVASLLPLAPTAAAAGELDLGVGLQATTTAWPDDHGGGGSVDARWWFRDWLGASFVGKEHYAVVDDRVITYLAVNAVARRTVGPIRTTASLGLVHQHEEPRAAIMAQPLQSLFGVGDGIRHRMGARAGVALALPITDHAHGDWYVALDLDATKLLDTDRGPGWMTSAGFAVGFTYDFTPTAVTR